MKRLLIVLAIAFSVTACKKDCPDPEVQVKKPNDKPDRNLPDSLFKTPSKIIKMP